MSRFLALDWDHGLLHLVAAEVRGNTVKVYKAVDWKEDNSSPNPANASELGERLKTLLRDARISAAPLLVTIGRERIILKHLHYPAVAQAEEPNLVRFQAVKELNEAPEDVVIDYTPVGQRDGSGEYEALAAILRQEMLQAYQTLAQAAGLKLAGLIPRPFCVSACLRGVMGQTVLTPAPEPADAPVAAVVLSEGWAEFCIVEGNNLLLSRPLAASPGDINPLVTEITRNLMVHTGQYPDKPLKGLYLAGLGSTELQSRLVDVVEMPIHPFDPFVGAESLELPAGNRGSYAGAVGALYASAGRDGLPINFLYPREPKVERQVSRLAVLVGALLFLIYGGGLLGGAHWVKHYNQKTVAALENEAKLVDQELFSTRLNLKNLEALGEWDNVVWLDELYELADRIPNVNSVRITQVIAEPLQRTKFNSHTARFTIKGHLVGGPDSRQQLETLLERFREEKKYYSVESFNEEPNDRFTLKVKVERRPPSEYKPPKVEEPFFPDDLIPDDFVPDDLIPDDLIPDDLVPPGAEEGNQ
jgi:hypothetical protein